MHKSHSRIVQIAVTLHFRTQAKIHITRYRKLQERDLDSGSA